jgi:hypothetical protein
MRDSSVRTFGACFDFVLLSFRNCFFGIMTVMTAMAVIRRDRNRGKGLAHERSSDGLLPVGQGVIIKGGETRIFCGPAKVSLRSRSHDLITSNNRRFEWHSQCGILRSTRYCRLAFVLPINARFRIIRQEKRRGYPS